MALRPERAPALLLVGVLAVALASGARPARAQAGGAPPAVMSDDAVERQRNEMYREGVALAEAGRWGEALERFQRVVAIRSAPRALMALAAAEEHVGRLVSAKRTYGKARADADADRDDALVAKADAALQALEPRIPRLAIVLPAGIVDGEARLDGAGIEISTAGVEVDPGVYHLVVSAPGRPSFEERLVISAGQRKDVAVALGPAAPGSAAPLLSQTAAPGAGDVPPPRARRGPPVGAWILGGAGVVAAAVGLAVRFQARQVYDDAAQTGETMRGNDARDRMIVGTAVAGVGLAAVVGGALWWSISY